MLDIMFWDAENVMRGAVQYLRLWNYGCLDILHDLGISILLSYVLSILTPATAMWQVQGWLAHIWARPPS